MKSSKHRIGNLLAALLLWPLFAVGFPPTPDHVIYGLVRDELGTPLGAANAEVILTASSGAVIRTDLVPNLKPGMNYRLRVPLDSGLTADRYKPSALEPTVPFRLSVKIGEISYLPIEMGGNYERLGDPAKETQLDLTLGEDLDGDGLPDAWERALLRAGQTLSDVTPDGDTDNDGMTDFEEYLAGTYAFDARDGFRLKIVGVNEGWPVLEFTAIRGRTYSIHRSFDFENWEPVSFRVEGADRDEPAQRRYQANDVRLLRVEAEPSDLEIELKGRGVFYKLTLE